MGHIYTIGQASQILNIPESTLRHYDKINLVRPAHKDPQTGYRYYGADQIGTLDRVRFLQNMGLTLQEIKRAFESNRPEYLIPILKEKLAKRSREIDSILLDIKTIDLYIHYLRHSADIAPCPEEISYKYVEEKHIIATEYKNEPEEISGDIELTRIQNLPEYRELRFLRQWGCQIDYGKLLENQFVIQKSFAYLIDAPTFESPYLKTLPAGYYLCCKAKLLSGQLGPVEKIARFFAHGAHRPGIVVANEYEENFFDFSNSVFEVLIQILSV